jgi:hypothetical protein
MDSRIVDALAHAQGRNELRLFQRGPKWWARVHRVNGGFWAEGHADTADGALTDLAEVLERMK